MKGQRLKVVIHFILLFIIIFASTQRVSAQEKFKGLPFISNFSWKQYNGSPFNWDIQQDLRGVVYVANNYFVLEYDGKNWRRIGLTNRSAVRSLAMDEKGKIYVGGQNDFGYLSPNEKGEMIFVSLKELIDKRFRNFDDVWKIYITSKGIAYCTVSGIYLYHNNKIIFIEPNNNILDLSFYAHNRLFAKEVGGGLYELKDGVLSRVPGSEILPDNNIADIKEWNNNFLIFTQKEGIYTFDGERRFQKWNNPLNSFFLDNKITTVTAIKNGYALGSVNKGLLLIDKNGSPMLHLDESKGLQSNEVENIFRDSNENLWLALSNGIDYIETASPFTLYNSSFGISGSGFTSFIDGSRMFLGTSTGLYSKEWGKEKAAFAQSSFQLVNNTKGQVYHIQKIDNTLLLSHHLGAFQIQENNAIQLFDGGTWLFFQPKRKPGFLIAGTYRGLWLYQSIHGKVKPLWKIKGFDESSRIVEQDEEGNIWVAHGYKGVYKIKLNDNMESVEEIHFYNSKHGLPSNLFINVFKIDRELVFTSERGLYKYNSDKHEFFPHQILNKLIGPTKQTSRLIEDYSGNIWFSTQDEIGILNKVASDNYQVKKDQLYKVDGKLVAGFEHFNIYNSSNVIIGTDEGFVHYNPSFEAPKERDFNIYISKVELTDKTDSILHGGSFSSATSAALKQPDASIYTLPYKMNSIRFSYQGLSYDESSLLSYQYLLEGLEKKWSSWGASDQKEYTNLHEGDYIFHVRAKDSNGKVSNLASYRLVISPPWYRTILAYLFYAISFLGVLWAVWKLSKLQQQKTMKFREAQLREEALQAEKEIIKLNSEKLEMELSHKQKELASSTIHLVRGVEAIQRIKEGLIKLASSAKEKAIHDELQAILGEVEKEINIETNWSQFELHFNQIHQDFLLRLKQEFPQLNHIDLKLCAYLRLNLSSKEIAPLLNLTIRGIEASRYRIRKKMNLSSEVNLTEFIINY